MPNLSTYEVYVWSPSLGDDELFSTVTTSLEGIVGFVKDLTDQGYIEPFAVDIGFKAVV